MHSTYAFFVLFVYFVFNSKLCRLCVHRASARDCLVFNQLFHAMQNSSDKIVEELLVHFVFERE